MLVHIYIYMLVHIYICMYIYIYIHVCMYLCMYMCIYVCKYVCMYVIKSLWGIGSPFVMNAVIWVWVNNKVTMCCRGRVYEGTTMSLFDAKWRDLGTTRSHVMQNEGIWGQQGHMWCRMKGYGDNKVTCNAEWRDMGKTRSRCVKERRKTGGPFIGLWLLLLSVLMTKI